VSAEQDQEAAFLRDWIESHGGEIAVVRFDPGEYAAFMATGPTTEEAQAWLRQKAEDHARTMDEARRLLDE
jgi:hypothetical protein